MQQRQTAERSALAQTKTREKIAMLRQKATDARANKPIRPRTRNLRRLKGCSTDTSNDFAKADPEVRRWKHEFGIANGKRALPTWSQPRRRTSKPCEMAWFERRRPSTISRISKAKPKNSSKPSEARRSPPSDAQFVEVERRTKQTTALVEYAKKASDAATCRSRDQGPNALQGAQQMPRRSIAA